MPTNLQRLIERYDQATAQLEEAVILRLQAALEASYFSLEAKVKAQYLKVEGDKLMVSRQSLKRLEQIKALLEVVSPEVAKQLEQNLQQILGASYQLGAGMAAELTQAIAPGISFKVAEVPIEAAVFAAKDSVGRLSKHSQEFREKASAIVTQGLIQGWAPAQVSTQMRQQLGIVKAKAEMIARTEVLSALNSSAKANYKNNGIRYVQLISTSDRRTCGLCRDRNLNVYRIDEISVPFHPNCRCFTMPYSPEWRSQGLIDEGWEKRYYAGDDEWEGDEQPMKPSSFEKAVGMEKAPAPVWTVKQGLLEDE